MDLGKGNKRLISSHPIGVIFVFFRYRAIDEVLLSLHLAQWKKRRKLLE